MIRGRKTALGLLLLGCSVVFQLTALAEEQGMIQRPPLPPDTYAVEWLLNGAVARSPDRWVVAVVEIASEPSCEGPKEQTFCTCSVRVVDLLGMKARGEEPTPLGKFRLITTPNTTGPHASPIGSKYLAAVVPVEGKPGTYGSTALLSSPSDADIERARELVKRMLGK